MTVQNISGVETHLAPNACTRLVKDWEMFRFVARIIEGNVAELLVDGQVVVRLYGVIDLVDRGWSFGIDLGNDGFRTYSWENLVHIACQGRERPYEENVRAKRNEAV